MKKKTYLLDVLRDNEVTSTIVLKNKRVWLLDFENKYNDIVDAYRNEKIDNFEVTRCKPFYKLSYRRWNNYLHEYIEYAYLYRFEEKTY